MEICNELHFPLIFIIFLISIYRRRYNNATFLRTPPIILYFREYPRSRASQLLQKAVRLLDRHVTYSYWRSLCSNVWPIRPCVLRQAIDSIPEKAINFAEAKQHWAICIHSDLKARYMLTNHPNDPSESINTNGLRNK